LPSRDAMSISAGVSSGNFQHYPAKQIDKWVDISMSGWGLTP